MAVVLFAVTCRREEEFQSAPPDNLPGAPADTHLRRGPGPTADGGSGNPVDAAMRRLAPGQVRYIGPDTMVVDSTVSVVVNLAKDSRFPQTPLPHKQVITAETKIGDSAKVCLNANPADFTISAAEGPCSKQPVSSGTENQWSWLVTPHRAGTGVLQVQVTALLARMPGKVVFDSSYAVIVHVAPRGLLTRVGDFLKSWEGIATSAAAIVAAIAGILRALKKGKESN